MVKSGNQGSRSFNKRFKFCMVNSENQGSRSFNKHPPPHWLRKKRCFTKTLLQTFLKNKRCKRFWKQNDRNTLETFLSKRCTSTSTRKQTQEKLNRNEHKTRTGWTVRFQQLDFIYISNYRTVSQNRVSPRALQELPKSSPRALGVSGSPYHHHTRFHHTR